LLLLLLLLLLKALTHDLGFHLQLHGFSQRSSLPGRPFFPHRACLHLFGRCVPRTQQVKFVDPMGGMMMGSDGWDDEEDPMAAMMGGACSRSKK
jgi:hypothetical protein